MNFEMEGEQMTLENDIKATTEKVKLEEVRTAKVASQRFKKILLRAYKNVLRYRLEQWKNSIR